MDGPPCTLHSLPSGSLCPASSSTVSVCVLMTHAHTAPSSVLPPPHCACPPVRRAAVRQRRATAAAAARPGNARASTTLRANSIATPAPSDRSVALLFRVQCGADTSQLRCPLHSASLCEHHSIRLAPSVHGYQHGCSRLTRSLCWLAPRTVPTLGNYEPEVSMPTLPPESDQMNRSAIHSHWHSASSLLSHRFL